MTANGTLAPRVTFLGNLRIHLKERPCTPQCSCMGVSTILRRIMAIALLTFAFPSSTLSDVSGNTAQPIDADLHTWIAWFDVKDLTARSLLTPALHSEAACGRMYLSHEPSGWSSREGRATPRAAGKGCRKRVPATGGHACGQSPVARLARSRERGPGNPDPLAGKSSLPCGGRILLQPESARRSEHSRLAARPSPGLAACRAPLRRSRGTQSRGFPARGAGQRKLPGPSRPGDRPA